MVALSTRRGMLGAIALAPIAVASCTVSAPAVAAAEAPSDELQRLISVWRAAEEACAPASEASQAALDAWTSAKEAVPHYTTTAGYESKGEGFIHLSTADPFAAPSARAVAEAWADKEWAGEYMIASRELIEADDRRQAEFARLRELHGVDAAGEEEDRLAEIAADAMWAVYDYPISTPEDLLIKLAIIEEQGALKECAGLLADDIRRVLKAAPSAACWR